MLKSWAIWFSEVLDFHNNRLGQGMEKTLSFGQFVQFSWNRKNVMAMEQKRMAGNNSAAGGDGGRECSWRVQQIRPPWLYRKDKVSVRWASKLQAHSFSHYQYYDTTAPRACGGSGEGFQKQGWILPCPQSTGGTKLLLQVLDECAKVFWLSLCRQLLCLLTDIQKKVFLYKVNRTVFLDGLWGQVYCFCYWPGTAALAENWAVLGSCWEGSFHSAWTMGKWVASGEGGQWSSGQLHMLWSDCISDFPYTIFLHSLSREQKREDLDDI